jgi:hypothetical protein
LVDERKTIESRFSKNKNAPYQQISIGDKVYFKCSGVKSIGYYAFVKKVEFYGSMDSISKLKEYMNEICIDESYINERMDRNYLTLIWFDKIEECDIVYTPQNKGNRMSWFVNWNNV